MKSGLSLIVFMLLVCPFTKAQDEASLSGTVQDSSGAVVPTATVKLTNKAQGTVRTAQTNTAGVYQFTFLTPGTYDIEFSSTGFKTQTRTDLTLAVAQNLRLDVNLEVGNVSENVTVSANTEAVNTESAELGAVVDNTKVVEMPLNGRTFYSLAVLAPNVTPPVQGSGLGYRGGFNVAGQPEANNTFTLNGMDNNYAAKSIPNFRPSIDAIQEFNLLTGVYAAEYGYASGGQVIVTTKSGGNQFHGSAYEFLRNQAVLSARNFFALPGPLPSFKRNQFGVTFGGPIQKDKTFFFYSYEGLRVSQGITAANGQTITTVPLAAMHTGDFSAILPKVTIKDPATGLPFSGNIIPQSQISPLGTALIAFYPLPNVPTPAGSTPGNNFNYQATRTERYNEHSLRVDHTFSAKDSAFATANYYYDFAHEPLIGACPTEALPLFGCDQTQKSELYGLSETHIFSPAMVNEARMSASVFIVPGNDWVSYIPYWSQFGIQPRSLNVNCGPVLGPPGTTVTGYTGLTENGSYRSAETNWQWNDTFSWTHGKHTIKIGGNLTHFDNNNANVNNVTGTASFTSTSQGPTSGYGLADMLLGLPTTTTNQPYNYVPNLYVENVSAFLQDDYKVSSSLTLNLGLRWEINTPALDYNHHLTNFDAAKGIPVTAGTDGFGEHLVGFDWHDYAPRLGFAWQPFRDGKTVLRGGIGTFYNNNEFYNTFSGIEGGYPYAISNTYTSSLAQPLLLSNPFPSGNAVISNTLKGMDPKFRNARSYEWSMGLQRQLMKDMVLEITYLGSSSSHLWVSRNINQPAPGPGTPTQVNARRPYPQYGSISFTEYDRNGHYESMNVSVRKRYGYGLSFLAAFNYGKAIDDAGSPTNAFNLMTARGLSSFDTRFRFVASPVYELPFGKGKPFASQGVLAAIVGGWQLSSLIQWQTGNPLTATISGNYSNSGGTTDRPNLIGDPNANAPHTPQEWFNTAAFDSSRAPSGAAGATYSFGNEGVGVITGPGFVQTDISVVRSFQAREWMKIEFRAEIFDLFNHPNFNFPGTVSNTASFGVISGALDPRESQFALKVLF